MAWNLKTRQYLSYSSLLGLTTLLVVVVYWLACPQWVYFRRGERYFFAHNFNRAIPAYEDAVAAGLKRPKALIHLGESYLATSQFRKALLVFEQVVRTHPDNLGALNRLAGLYDQFERVDEAIALLQRYRQQPGVAEPVVLVRLADLYKRKQDFTAAEKLYRQALPQTSEPLSVQLKLAEVLSWEKKYDEAIKIYWQILAVHPENRTARFNLARVLSWKGRKGEAVQQYRRLLGETP
jgi:tetratricopeptide (TPR) repeat protein